MLYYWATPLNVFVFRTSVNVSLLQVCYHQCPMSLCCFLPQPTGKGPRLPEVYCVISRLGCFDLFSTVSSALPMHVHIHTQTHVLETFSYSKQAVCGVVAAVNLSHSWSKWLSADLLLHACSLVNLTSVFFTFRFPRVIVSFTLVSVVLTQSRAVTLFDFFRLIWLLINSTWVSPDCWNKVPAMWQENKIPWYISKTVCKYVLYSLFNNAG